MKSLPSDPQTSVLVTALASDGDGIARTTSGRVVFVEGAVPGDRVELAGLRERRGTLRAGIARIVEASSDRIAPPCPHFGICGGCAWQHVRYATQLEAKRKNVRAALERIGGLRLEDDVEIVASPHDYHYRARTRVVEVEGGVGYRRRASIEALRVEECPVLLPAVQTALAEQGRRVAGSQARAEGEAGRGGGAREVEGASARGRARSVDAREWVITAGSAGPARVEAVGDGGPASDTAGANDPTALRGARGEIEIEVLGERLRVGGAGFIQGNALLWERLAREVRDRCRASRADRGPQRFVELYAGIGFFTLPLARLGLTGIAVESDPRAVADLGFNLERAGLAGAVEAVGAQVEHRSDLPTWLADADLLLVDPPRIGLDALVRESIAKSGPGIVVYVSCDPATLARDVKTMVAHDYRVESILAFDLFPQTPHVETVVRLER